MKGFSAVGLFAGKISMAFSLLAPPLFADFGHHYPCTPKEKHMHEIVLSKLNQRTVPKLAVNEELGESSHAKKTRGELAFGPEHKSRISFMFYQTKELPPQGKAPILFLFSGMSGINILDKYLAHFFVDKGYSVVLSHYFDLEENQSIQKVNESMREGVYANLALVDYFTSLPNIDGDKVGMLGMSFGGIRAVHQTVLDKRIKASVLMVTGAPLAEIMAKSELPVMEELRNLHMKKAGLSTVDQYFKAIEKQLTFTIADWSCRRSPDDFSMYISTSDKMVPSMTQWQLHEQLGSPQMRKSSLGHVNWPVWASLWHKKDMLRFFNKQVLGVHSEESSPTPSPIPAMGFN